MGNIIMPKGRPVGRIVIEVDAKGVVSLNADKLIPQQVLGTLIACIGSVWGSIMRPTSATVQEATEDGKEDGNESGGDTGSVKPS